MNENELRERYIRRAFQYESAIDALLTKGLIDMEAASAAKERFYDTLNEERILATQKIRDYHESISLYMRTLAHDGMVSLTELARQYSDESPGCNPKLDAQPEHIRVSPPVGIGSECRIR